MAAVNESQVRGTGEQIIGCGIQITGCVNESNEASIVTRCGCFVEVLSSFVE